MPRDAYAQPLLVSQGAPPRAPRPGSCSRSPHHSLRNMAPFAPVAEGVCPVSRDDLARPACCARLLLAAVAVKLDAGCAPTYKSGTSR